MHLRGLFYRIVASATVLRPDNGQAFINTETNWRWLKEDASKAARWLGYIPINGIRDERNEPPTLYGTDGVPIEARCTRRLAVTSGDMAAKVPTMDDAPNLVTERWHLGAPAVSHRLHRREKQPG